MHTSRMRADLPQSVLHTFIARCLNASLNFVRDKMLSWKVKYMLYELSLCIIALCSSLRFSLPYARVISVLCALVIII
jgi:hypothetical protein